jgi:nitroimidazol reductase NimA-like FMN-containing flavoprotein (pyridoxamine 5'-phosphate oxidase superfamily)
MRRKDKEVQDSDVVLDVLSRGEVLHLAMIAADGSPYVVPLSYAARPGTWGSPLEGLRLFVHGAGAGKKIDALRKDPRVCFEVAVDVETIRAQKACDFSVRYRCVIGTGRAAFLVDPGARARALSLIAERYVGPGTVVPEGEAERIAIIEIAVESVSCKVSPPPGR